MWCERVWEWSAGVLRCYCSDSYINGCWDCKSTFSMLRLRRTWPVCTAIGVNIGNLDVSIFRHRVDGKSNVRKCFKAHDEAQLRKLKTFSKLFFGFTMIDNLLFTWYTIQEMSTVLVSSEQVKMSSPSDYNDEYTRANILLFYYLQYENQYFWLTN